MIDVCEDVHKLTLLPKNIINTITELECCCICHGLTERDSNIVDYDIGIGTISVLVENDGVSWKFIPSQKFEGMVRDSILTNHSPLIEKAEDTVIARLSKTFKDMFDYGG